MHLEKLYKIKDNSQAVVMSSPVNFLFEHITINGLKLLSPFFFFLESKFRSTHSLNAYTSKTNSISKNFMASNPLPIKFFTILCYHSDL